MSAIRGQNTSPELQVRRALHARGFRYALHKSDLPGKPDLALRKYGAVIFVHGCFWHKHDCSAFKMPTERREFWEKKICGNAARDAVTAEKLRQAGWRVATVWECSIRGKNRRGIEEVSNLLVKWLLNDTASIEIQEKARD
jgi:DNA mismatch endonuclease (patch repair protein)